MQETLSPEVDEGEPVRCDLVSWEKDVIRFNRRYDQRIMQTWEEVKIE